MSEAGNKMQSRVLNQFTVTQRLLDLLEVTSNRMDDTDSVLDYLTFNRFIDTTVGVWLDIVGRIVGIPRRPFADLENVFTYKSIGDPDDADLAFGTTSDPAVGGVYNTLNGAPSTTPITDEVFRQLIKAKIFATYAYPSIPSIYLFVKFAFGVESIIRSPYQNEITVELATAISRYERRVLVEFAPIAAGKNITIINWP